MDKYMFTHENTCTYEGCEKLFGPKTSMKSHFNRVHMKINIEKRWKCDLCNYKTSQKQQITSHMNSKHLKIKPFKCSICVENTEMHFFFKVNQ